MASGLTELEASSLLRTGIYHRADLIWLILAAVVLVAFRLHAFDLPLETDECNYAYIGSRLLAGDRLYIDVWDHQPPGVFILFAAAIALFGDAPIVFRSLAMAFSLLTLILVYFIAKELHPPQSPLAKGGGIVPLTKEGVGGGLSACAAGNPLRSQLAKRGGPAVAAVLFALASSDPGTAGEGCNREIYMNTLILAAWWAALRAHRESRAIQDQRATGGAWIFIAGLLLGFASSIKTNVAIHWVFLAGWLAWTCSRKITRSNQWRHIAVSLLMFGLGPLLVWGATFGYFAVTHRWHEFIDAVFTFNLAYSDTSLSVLDRFKTFFSLTQRHPFVFESALPLWTGGGIAAVWLAGRTVLQRSAYAALILALVLAGYVATCLPGWFWPHYYYLLIPSLALAAGVFLGDVADGVDVLLRSNPPESPLGKGGGWNLPRDGRTPLLAKAVRLLIFSVLPVWLGIAELRHYLVQPPFGITVKRYNSRDFWGRAQGENVAKVTDPTDPIFVFGNDAEIYSYSHRRCASRYTMITGLHTGYPGADERRRILIDDLERDPPRLILVVFNEDPWDEWVTFLRRHYGEPVGWDFRDGTSDKPIMFVLARTDKPIPRIDWNWDRSSVGGWIPKQGS